MMGYRLVLATLYRSLQSILSKTSRIDDIKYPIQCTWHIRTLGFSFHVGHLPTRLQWQCRCHLVESRFPLEFGRQATYMETNPYPTRVPLHLGVVYSLSLITLKIWWASGGCHQGQCSKLKPSYEFHVEGLSNFSPPNLRRQSKNIKMRYKTHIKFVHELYGTCFQYNVKN